jgi:AP-1-like transcription factor
MDFSYFTSAPQPYQFFGLPHTPATSQTGHLDEFRTAPSTVSRLSVKEEII